MIKYLTTSHRENEEFIAPEGYHFKASHLVGPNTIAVIWEGHPSPPGLVKLCNQLVRAAYTTVPLASYPSIRDTITSIERELDAHRLREFE